MRPIAFRIWDFRSIKDTGECTLSGDNITVLAGQNEAGKSAALMALRDFDLPQGKPPLTSEFWPEGNQDAVPKVGVLFDVDPGKINEDLAKSNRGLPKDVVDYLNNKRQMWIYRELATGNFAFDPAIAALWPSIKPDDTESIPESEGIPDVIKTLSIDEAWDHLRPLWPNFVFFDSFQDQLPRQILVEQLHDYRKASEEGRAVPKQQPGQRSVEDFLDLAGVDLERVIQLKGQDKALGNYLKGRTASITGDFLTYWKQSVDGDQKVELQVRFGRNEQGVLQLSFYVHDGADQYPEQRSKGFLWFLSFYLRLAAVEARDPESSRVLLIDEPGTYLHAKAQRDVLHLFEDKLADRQQVIYSTHSPYLLPSEKLHRLRVVLRDGSKGTLILDRLTHPALRGDEFSDTLYPIISAIGLDVRERLTGLSPKNLLVEGLSDYIYLSGWIAELKSPLLGNVAIFPGTGAATLTALASLCIGWGLRFAVLLDRDDAGRKAASKFERDFGLPPARIVHPHGAVTIEDVFEISEFRLLLSKLDPTLEMEPGETPSKAVKRLKVDKVLLARRFSEETSAFPQSAGSFAKLLEAIRKSLED